MAISSGNTTEKLKYLPCIQDITKPQIWEKSHHLISSPKFCFGSCCTPQTQIGNAGAACLGSRTRARMFINTLLKIPVLSQVIQPCLPFCQCIYYLHAHKYTTSYKYGLWNNQHCVTKYPCLNPDFLGQLKIIMD